MVCEDQVQTELPAAAERPDSRHGALGPLRRPGLLSPDKLKAAIAARADDLIVPASALTGEGCEDLLATVSDVLTADARVCTFVIPASDGQRLAFLHARGEVLEEETEDSDDGPEIRITVRMAERELGRFAAL